MYIGGFYGNTCPTKKYFYTNFNPLKIKKVVRTIIYNSEFCVSKKMLFLHIFNKNASLNHFLILLSRTIFVLNNVLNSAYWVTLVLITSF